ncbi:unnamed protein product [Closterium sp. NIES-53]
MLYVPDLRFNMLFAGQLRDSGVMLTTDPYTRDLILTYAPPDTPVESHKYLGRARSLNGIYVLDFDIPNCQASFDELVDLVPLDFPHMNVETWQHPDGRPWIRRSPHPREINLHQPGPDGLCTTCFTPMASSTEEVERDLTAIQEAESAEAEPEGMTEMELAITSHRIFGTEVEKLGMKEQERPAPVAKTLCWILKDAMIGTEEEEKAYEEEKGRLYQERLAAGWSPELARRGGWGDPAPPGATWGSATGASGTVSGWGTDGGHWDPSGGGSDNNDNSDAPPTREELEEIPREIVVERGKRSPRVAIPLGRPPQPPPSPPHSPYHWSPYWLEIEEGNAPSTPPRDTAGPISRPYPFACLIEGTRNPLNVIPDCKFLALYLTTAPAEEETAAEAEEAEEDDGAEPREEEGPVLDIPQETDAKVAEFHARYLRTPGTGGSKEFCSHELEGVLTEKGIKHHISLPYAHQQQGVAERTNCTLMTKYGPTAATISKFTQRACWGVHLGLSHEYRGWLILDINTCKVAPARDILFYEQLTLKQWTEDQIHQVTRAYANNGRSFAYPEDEAAAAALDSDPADDLSES